jgi:hypothetical protein
VVVISMICTNVIAPPPGATGWPDDGQTYQRGPGPGGGGVPRTAEGPASAIPAWVRISWWPYTVLLEWLFRMV